MNERDQARRKQKRRVLLPVLVSCSIIIVTVALVINTIVSVNVVNSHLVEDEARKATLEEDNGQLEKSLRRLKRSYEEKKTALEKKMSNLRQMESSYEEEKAKLDEEMKHLKESESNYENEKAVLEEKLRDLEEKNNIHETDSNPITDAAKNKMNILFLYGDDWRFDSLGAMNPIVHTPNLDKLATEGILFAENAVTTSICWISRSCLATGQHYARHKTIDLSDPVPFHKHWNDTLFAKLKDNGYHTVSVGKWQPGQMQPWMFDMENTYAGFHYSGKNHITDMNQKHAIRFLGQRQFLKNVKDKPFALFVNFFAPHHWDGNPEQYVPQNRTKSLYKDIEIPFAPTCTEEAWKKMPPFFNDLNDGRARWRQRFDGKEMAQKMIKNYYRLISGVDEACGNILDELDRQGLTNNTLIIFTTDNGYYHAEHGLADKFYANQESIKVPLIIKDPRMSKDMIGTRNDDFTLSIDLAPTMLAAAGIDIPDRMQGTDMSVLYKREHSRKKVGWRKSFFYEYPGMPGNIGHIPVQALVQKDYKYIYWPKQDYEEMFYLPIDHYEEKDLSKNPAYNDTMQYLREKFKKSREEAQ